ncbi:hypothetical protein WA026_017444 [Henosepilachna vigintioctopunctata]|uniref:Uncharacterized protein n=1 Tax=Henosepilachna vigintioctopunctata TaxID=420089 RepID=A0AAW1VGY1_9CUCU
MAKFFVYMQENPSEEKYVDFEKLVKLNLWSNKRDRPLKDYLRGQLKNIKDIDAADVNILCNDCRHVWNLFQSDIEVIDSDLIISFWIVAAMNCFKTSVWRIFNSLHASCQNKISPKELTLVHMECYRE